MARFQPQLPARSIAILTGAIILTAFVAVHRTSGAMIAATAVKIGGTQIGTLSVWTDTDIPAAKKDFFNAGPAAAVNATVGSTFAEFDSTNNIAAALAPFGYNHFNWINYVASGTANSTPGSPLDRSKPVPFPFIDPLSGGNSGNNFVVSPDDTLPYYWGEAAPTAAEQPGNTNINGANSFDYYDHSTGNGTPNATWSFITYLVAVKEPLGIATGGTFLPIIGFDWTFKQNATNDGQLAITGLAVDPVAFNTQVANLNTALQQPYDFPNWRAVPEPSCVALLAAATAAMLARPRHRSCRAC